jgi:adenylate cyclase
MGLLNWPAALDLLHRAIDLDPGFGPALAMAASLHAVLSLRVVSNDCAMHREQSLALMQRALQVAGDDPAVLGTVAQASLIIGRELDSIEPLIERALILNPGSAANWLNSGRFRVAVGEPDLAVKHIETALRLDPLSSSRFEGLADLGAARLLQRRFDEAVRLCRQSIELQPTFAPAQAWLASALGHAGRIQEAKGALAEFHAAGVGTIESFAERRFRTAEGRKLFLEGVAKAEADPGALAS